MCDYLNVDIIIDSDPIMIPLLGVSTSIYILIPTTSPAAPVPGSINVIMIMSY